MRLTTLTKRTPTNNFFQIGQLERERDQRATEADEAVLSSELYLQVVTMFTSVDQVSLHAGSLRHHVQRYMVNGSGISRQQIGKEVAKVIKRARHHFPIQQPSNVS